MKFYNFLLLSVLVCLKAVGSVDPSQMPYLDQDFGCTSQADANRFVKDFNINVRSFGGMELCNPNVDTKRLFNDLALLEKGDFNQDSGNKFVRGFVPVQGYYQWLKQETRGVERGQDIPYATAYNSGGYFTMQDGWAKLSTLGRVGTFVHEARHTAGYRHISCNQGPYQGSSVAGCDSNYNYGGSHAVEMEYYARVSVQGRNFHPVYKKMARLMAIARSNIFFNTPILQAREVVVGLNYDRSEALIFENGQWIKREVPQAQGRLKRTSFGGVIFDGLKALSVELYENSGFSDLVPDTYSYFKLLAESSNRVKEFEEFDNGVKRFVVRITSDNKITSYDFPNGKWGRDMAAGFNVVHTSTAIMGKSQTGLYLVAESGEIYNFQPQQGRLISTGQKWATDVQEIIVHKGQNLVLMNNGRVMVNRDSVLLPWPETNEAFSGLISAPLYDGFEVVKE
jgi:hypothetical protein